MSTVRFNLLDGNQPVQIDMVDPIIKQQQLKPDAYGQTASNRLLLSNATMVACLWLDDSLSSRDMKRLVNEFSRKQPRAVTLGRPIMAIHLVQTGLGWPDDEHHGPTSTFNCLPVEEWAAMASKPPVEAEHPLLNQPPETIWFQDAMFTGMPASVHYDSICNIERRRASLLITVVPQRNGELLGHAIIAASDEEVATGLAEGLRLRRVRRVSQNGWVVAFFLYPQARLCRGAVPRNPEAMPFELTCSGEELWQKAQASHPDEITRSLAQWRAD